MSRHIRSGWGSTAQRGPCLDSNTPMNSCSSSPLHRYCCFSLLLQVTSFQPPLAAGETGHGEQVGVMYVMKALQNQMKPSVDDSKASKHQTTAAALTITTHLNSVAVLIFSTKYTSSNIQTHFKTIYADLAFLFEIPKSRWCCMLRFLCVQNAWKAGRPPLSLDKMRRVKSANPTAGRPPSFLHSASFQVSDWYKIVCCYTTLIWRPCFPTKWQEDALNSRRVCLRWSCYWATNSPLFPFHGLSCGSVNVSLIQF